MNLKRRYLMAYEIKHFPLEKMGDIIHALENALQQSRFTADICPHRSKITMHNIRLRESKPYCGNHPYPCPVNPFGFERPHRKDKRLEGADWVAFNDMINDTLDNLKILATVKSRVCLIRKGAERCVRYTGHTMNGIHYEWDYDSGCFENRIGLHKKQSSYPNGTPGIPTWERS